MEHERETVPEDQFRRKGFLSQASARARKYLRQKNKEWFSLADKFVFLLQEIAIRTSESETVKGTTLTAPALAAAIALRSAGLSQAAILLIERGMVVETRIMIRSLLENAFCIAALIENKDEFIEALKKDRAASRKALASIALEEFPEHKEAQNLRAFLEKQAPKLKHLNMGEIAKSGPLKKEHYLLYRMLSNDSAHLSSKSLERHYRILPEENVWNGYKMGVGEDKEIIETLWYLALSIMHICIGITEITKDQTSNKKANDLVKKYEYLYETSNP